MARKAAALELKLAPEAVAARKAIARQDRRVEARREDSGNASLSGRELDTADVIASKAYIDAVALRRALEARGLHRILCEGGPSLFGDLAAAGVVDELCISLTPILAGPSGRRVIGGSAWEGVDPSPMRLLGLLEEDGALFCRYRL